MRSSTGVRHSASVSLYSAHTGATEGPLYSSSTAVSSVAQCSKQWYCCCVSVAQVEQAVAVPVLNFRGFYLHPTITMSTYRRKKQAGVINWRGPTVAAVLLLMGGGGRGGASRLKGNGFPSEEEGFARDKGGLLLFSQHLSLVKFRDWYGLAGPFVDRLGLQKAV